MTNDEHDKLSGLIEAWSQKIREEVEYPEENHPHIFRALLGMRGPVTTASDDEVKLVRRCSWEIHVSINDLKKWAGREIRRHH